jgi:hypothetical protein
MIKSHLNKIYPMVSNQIRMENKTILTHLIVVKKMIQRITKLFQPLSMIKEKVDLT